MNDRIDLARMKPEQIAPLEALMSSWPDCWRDLATSHYVTLLSGSAAALSDAEPAELARLAAALTLGIVQDLGGTQPYIPVGAVLAASSKARRAIELLEQRKSYKQVADATGLTESRVRQIESEWRRQQMAARQQGLFID